MNFGRTLQKHSIYRLIIWINWYKRQKMPFARALYTTSDYKQSTKKTQPNVSIFLYKNIKPISREILIKYSLYDLL